MPVITHGSEPGNPGNKQVNMRKSSAIPNTRPRWVVGVVIGIVLLAAVLLGMFQIFGGSSTAGGAGAGSVNVKKPIPLYGTPTQTTAPPGPGGTMPPGGASGQSGPPLQIRGYGPEFIDSERDALAPPPK
jgi:hypothetical protein